MTDHDKTARDKPIRVLHIAFTMKARGTETWLMHLLRRIDRTRIHMDFVTIKGETGFYDEEIQALGSTLHPLPPPTDRKSFVKAFRSLLKSNAYDVVHAHPYSFSGILMHEAWKAKIPVRITHSHTDRRKADARETLWKRMYYAFMKRIIHKCSTHRLAASPDAALSLFGKEWRDDPNYHLLYCGIDLLPFENINRSVTRESLGIPENVRVIGHVGGLYEEKNHQFILKLFSQLNDDRYLLLVGAGPLRKKLEEQAVALGIEDRVIFTGARNDVPNLLSLMDVFLFPSIFEGLGLSLVEAQASGKYCVISDTIPRDATINPDLVHRLSLTDDLILWTRQIEIFLQKKPYSKSIALSVAKTSVFNIERNVGAISNLYESAVKQENL